MHSFLSRSCVCGLLLAVSCATRSHRAAAPPEEAGLRDFQTYCAACHQYDGQAVGEAPPLDHSPFVEGPEERLIKIVLHGVRGRMEIQGKVYDSEMPGFAQILDGRRTAVLVSFVRRRFAGIIEPTTVRTVLGIREQNRGRVAYWDAGQLLLAP